VLLKYDFSDGPFACINFRTKQSPTNLAESLNYVIGIAARDEGRLDCISQ
jgi:hypothetical protein